MVNRLAKENSPYLIQHASNPVDWYPWGPEALEISRQQDKPVFLSIGYAACHWCHVMAHESFEDPGIADILNKNFVNVKVDREENPDIDHIYMSAVVAMTGQGGWPLSVFLDTEGRPFYGGTYFPPQRRHGMPSFREVLSAVIKSWAENRSQITQSAREITAYIAQEANISSVTTDIEKEILEKSTLKLAQAYDWKYGGWGKAPKFPQPMSIEYLLRRSSRIDRLALEMATHALDSMARGGMYDLVGGGFSRYSTDNDWHIPHFEKMLYDNAQLAQVYLHAYLLTKKADYRQICEEVLDFTLRELTEPGGGFYCSLDADSEGEEGKYYSWTAEEIDKIIIKEEEKKLFVDAFGLNEPGDFEGKYVLQRKLSDSEISRLHNLTAEEANLILSKIRQQLLDYREKRIRPNTDDKILAGWNGLALIAFAEAARYLTRIDYLEAAQKNARFLIGSLMNDNVLLRSWRHNHASHPGYLEDYCSLILGLIALYQADWNPEWLHQAEGLSTIVVNQFKDNRNRFFDSPANHNSNIIRPRDLQDNATPSGNALAAMAFLKLSNFTGNLELERLAEYLFLQVQPFLAEHPLSFSCWLCAIDYYLNPTKEVVVVGDPSSSMTQSLIDVLNETYRPDMLISVRTPSQPDDYPLLLQDKKLILDLPTAYVCENFVCKLPVNSPDSLRSQLNP